VPLHGTGQVRYTRSAADSDTSPAIYLHQTFDHLKADDREPTQIRLGVAWVAPQRLTFSGDMSLHLPVRYDLVRLNDESARTLIPFVTRVERLPVINFNFGAEWLILRMLSVSAGFFTDLASSPSLSGPAHAGDLSEPALPHVDYYGVTGVVSFLSANTLARLGVLYSFGRGYEVVAKDTLSRLVDDAPAFVRVDLFRSFFYVFVSTTVRFL
jgi:hypothetical protein